MITKFFRYKQLLFSSTFLLFILLLSACKNGSIDSPKDEAYFEKIISNALDLRNKYGKAKSFAYLDSVKKHDPKSNGFLAFKILCFKTELFVRTNELDSATLLVNEMLPLLNKLSTPDKIPNHFAKAYFSLSDVNFKARNYLEAYKWLFLGKQIGSDVLNNCTISEYNYRIGMILYKQESYLEAARSFKLAFNQSNNCGTTFESIYRQQEIISNTGLSYFKANRLDSAVYFFNNALQFINQKSKNNKDHERYFEVAEGVVLGNLGQVYDKKGMYQKAISLLEKSIAINEKDKLEAEDANIQRIHLAEVELKIKDFNKLRDILTQVKSELDTTVYSYSLANYYKLESEYQAAIGNNSSAYGLLNKYNLLINNLQDKDKALTQTNISEQLRFIESQNNYSSLQKSDNLKSIYLTATIIIISMGIGVIILIFYSWKKSKNNIKVLKILNDKINQQRDQLIEKSKEQDKILRVVAHDLRNPIGGISSISQIMKLEGLSPKEEEMVTLIENTSKDALTLINEIMEFTNDDLKDLEVEKVHAYQLLTNAVALLRFKTEEKNQKINLENAPIHIYVKVNREKISRVINNLIINASKFSEKGKSIDIYTKHDDKFLTISIKDNGVGIPKNMENQIFEPLTTVKRAGTSGEKSFGMGLSICKQIIEAHGGKIWFERLENGTIFSFKIPLY